MQLFHPAAARLDGRARGGVPDVTPQDVAAALGMIGDDFAREVFCAVHWPDGARLVRRELIAIVAKLQMEEWLRRERKLLDAKIAVALESLSDYPIAQRESALKHAAAETWPSLDEEPYQRICDAVIAEIRAPRNCPACHGRCFATKEIGDGIESCSHCNAIGHVQISDRQRATLLKRSKTSYERTWKAVYEWTFAAMTDAENRARRKLETLLA